MVDLLQAKLDGFRVFKIRNRDDFCKTETVKIPHGETGGFILKFRKYTGPVYVLGLPGDVDLFNKDLGVCTCSNCEHNAC